MGNSPLVTYTRLSPNHSGQRNHAIDRISIHCTAGQCAVETLGSLFAARSRQASSNYGVGPDGRVGMYVEEKNCSWCTSSPNNDNRAVTIETASDSKHPYAVREKAYAALLDLCTDICKRNGKKRLLWFGDKDKTLAYSPKADEMVLTVHRWFANKACPGEYLYSRHGEIAAEVTRRLGADSAAPAGGVAYRVKIDADNFAVWDGPGTNYRPVSTIAPGIYTVVEEADGPGASRWGRLKSGAGWIALDYARRV